MGFIFFFLFGLSGDMRSEYVRAFRRFMSIFCKTNEKTAECEVKQNKPLDQTGVNTRHTPTHLVTDFYDVSVKSASIDLDNAERKSSSISSSENFNVV